VTAQLQLPFCDEKTPEEKFRDFHRRHPEVYRELRRRAFALKAKGRKRWGIRNLWECMRYDFALDNPEEDDFRLNDHYTRYYARLLMNCEPGLVGFFETRERKT
jgi:hypothetical protein